MTTRLTSLFAGLLLLACLALPARGAEITTVMSSADQGDPFDGWLYQSYQWQLRKSRITREYIKTDPGIGNSLGFAKELDSERTIHSIDINARFGLYKGLELFFVFPIVISDSTNLEFPADVGPDNSTVAPKGKPSLFDMPNGGTKRSGFGDMSLGIRYAPFEQWRDEYYPTWLIGFTYTIPTGKIKRADNSAVGAGIHTLKLETVVSRRIRFAEPYFGLSGNLRIPSSNSLFKKYGPSQDKIWPGSDLGLTLGVEFFPWDAPRADGKKARYFSIDIGVSAVYTFQGRAYTDLFEAFGSSSCTGLTSCTGNSNKGLTQYDRTLGNDPNPEITFMDGITTVGAYGTYSAWAGFNLQPIEYFSISFRFTYSYETAHYLTYSNVGRDLDGLKGVEYKNSLGDNEYNPVYNSTVDDPGHRFKSRGANMYGIMLMIVGKY